MATVSRATTGWHYLLLGPDTPEARLIDLNYADWLGTYGGATLHRIDPDVVYRDRGLDGLERHVASVVADNDIRVLFYCLGTEFDFRPTFLRDALGNVLRVLILGDDEYYFDVSHKYYAQCFDLVLTTNPLCDRYRLYGIEAEFLPTVYDADTFAGDASVTPDIDVSFIGAMEGKAGRDEYARALTRAGIQVQLFGAGTPAGIISKRQVVDIYRRSRINLNFSGGVSSTPLTAGYDINRRIRQVKGRCTKIALCGGFLLSEYAPGTERLFQIGSEIDVFHDEEDFIDKVRFYLRNEEQRVAMARRAHARALERYDAAKFWPPLLQRINEAAARKVQVKRASLPVYFDKRFWASFAAARCKYLVAFLFSGKLSLLLQELVWIIRLGAFNWRAGLWYMAAGLHSQRDHSPFAGFAARVAHGVRKKLKVW